MVRTYIENWTVEECSRNLRVKWKEGGRRIGRWSVRCLEDSENSRREMEVKICLQKAVKEQSWCL
jgi:hypothetical protein